MSVPPSCQRIGALMSTHWRPHVNALAPSFLPPLLLIVPTDTTRHGGYESYWHHRYVLVAVVQPMAEPIAGVTCAHEVQHYYNAGLVDT